MHARPCASRYARLSGASFIAVSYSSMAASTVAYFVGNASGLDNGMERTYGSKLGYYCIGWELNNIAANMTHLEEAEEAEAKALKALNPGMWVGVTRNSVVLTTFWDSAREKMEDPAYNHFWLQCDGKPCTNVRPTCGGSTSPARGTRSAPRPATRPRS